MTSYHTQNMAWQSTNVDLYGSEHNISYLPFHSLTMAIRLPLMAKTTNPHNILLQISDFSSFRLDVIRPSHLIIICGLFSLMSFLQEIDCISDVVLVCQVPESHEPTGYITVIQGIKQTDLQCLQR